MTTSIVTRTARRSVAVTSEHFEDIVTGARMLFATPDEPVEYRQDHLGFHIAHVNSGAVVFEAAGSWKMATSLMEALQMARAWIDGLSDQQKREINASLPMEQLRNSDPGINLGGYNMQSSRTPNGLHLGVTIIPAWI